MSLRGAGDITRAQAAGLLHPGYVTGRWYGERNTAFVDQAVAANTLYAYPAPVYYPVTVDRLVALCTTGAVGNLKMGIYTNQSGGPASLVAEIAVDVDTTLGAPTNLIGTFSVNPVLPPGFYWLASVFSATPSMRCWQNNAPQGGGPSVYVGGQFATDLITNAGGSPPVRITRNAALPYVPASAFLPASFGAFTVGAGAPGSPIMNWRAA